MPIKNSEIRNIQRNGAASMNELREFVAGLHGKNPQEVLGAVAESQLLRSIVMATFGIAALLVFLTVTPYFMQKLTKAPPVATPAAADETPDTQPTTDVPADAPAAANPGMTPADAPAAMGIGETKVADPSANPLDKELDGLLDGIE